MTEDQPPAPGHDEIIVTAPDGRQVCHSRGHARLGVLAEVVVTFGELGTRWQPGAVFQHGSDLIAEETFAGCIRGHRSIGKLIKAIFRTGPKGTLAIDEQ